MGQVNVNPPPSQSGPVAPAPADGTGIGFIVGILIAILIIALLVWFLLINPGGGANNGGTNTGNQATPSASAVLDLA
jgi:archaellin